MTAYWSVCCRILWTAGAVAAVGTITYPAISVYVSANASPDQQGCSVTVFFGNFCLTLSPIPLRL